MQYTDATKVMVRGDMHDETTDTSSLPRGQLRAGLPDPSYIQMGSSNHDHCVAIYVFLVVCVAMIRVPGTEDGHRD